MSSHLDPCNVSFLTCLKFKLIFYSNLCSGFPVVIHVQDLGRKLCAHSHLFHLCYTSCQSNPPWINYPISIYWSTNYEASNYWIFHHLIIQALFVYQEVAVSIKKPFSPEDGDTVLEETLVVRQPYYTACGSGTSSIHCDILTYQWP